MLERKMPNRPEQPSAAAVRFRNAKFSMGVPALTCRSLYGFISAECSGEIEMLPGNRPNCIPAGRVAALVGSPAVNFPVRNKARDGLRRMRIHQRVLERVMRRVPVLPVHFTSRLPNRRAVELVARENEDAIVKAINSYGHLQQVEVLVTGPTIQSPAGARLRAAREHIRLELKGMSLSMREEQVQDARILLWVTLLIRSWDERRLDGALARLGGEYGDWLHFRCVGPLPPCKFIRAHVTRAPSPKHGDRRWTLTLTPAVHRGADQLPDIPNLSLRQQAA